MVTCTMMAKSCQIVPYPGKLEAGLLLGLSKT